MCKREGTEDRDVTETKEPNGKGPAKKSPVTLQSKAWTHCRSGVPRHWRKKVSLTLFWILILTFFSRIYIASFNHTSSEIGYAEKKNSIPTLWWMAEKHFTRGCLWQSEFARYNKQLVVANKHMLACDVVSAFVRDDHDLRAINMLMQGVLGWKVCLPSSFLLQANNSGGYCICLDSSVSNAYYMCPPKIIFKEQCFFNRIMIKWAFSIKNIQIAFSSATINTINDTLALMVWLFVQN